MSDHTERVPPHDLEAERAVLGALLRDFEEAWPKVQETGLKASDFYATRHAETFRRIAFASWQPGGPDPIMLARDLPENVIGSGADRVAWVTDLVSGIHLAANAGLYATRIREMANRRTVIRKGHQIIQQAFESNGEDVGEFIRGAVEDLRVIQEEGATRGKYLVETGLQFKAKDLPPREMLIGRGILGRADWLHVQGMMKAGKSLLALSMVLALIKNEKANAEWVGFSVFGPARVLYLVGEGGERGFNDRLERMGAYAYREEELERLHLWFPRPKLISPLANPDHFTRLRNTILEHGIEVLVIDMLRKFSAPRQLNKEEDAGPIADSILELKEDTGCAVITLHHTRKAGLGSTKGSPEEGSGSHVIGGSADAILSIDIEGELSEPERRLTFTIRHGAPVDPMIVKRTASLDYQIVTTQVGRPKKTKAADVVALLKDGEPRSSKTVSKALVVTERTARKRIKEAVEDGLVEMLTRDFGGEQLYRIVEPEAIDGAIEVVDHTQEEQPQ